MLGRLASVGSAVGIIAVIALVTPASAAVTTSSSATVSPSDTVVLTGQTSAVRQSQPFVVHVAVASSEPRSNLELGASVFSRLTSRSAFSQTVQGRVEGRVIGSAPPRRLTALPSDSSGASVLTVDTTGADGYGPNLADCRGGCEGVYPVRIELRDAGSGSLLDDLVTHLVFVNPPAGAPKLNASLVLPVHLAPTLAPDGQQHLSASGSEAMSALATSLATPGGSAVPVVLAPTPETIQALASSGRARDQETLTTLSRLAANPALHPLVAEPYVPVDLGALADAGLGSEVTAQLQRGQQILNATLGPKRDPATWLATGPLDQTALDQLQGMDTSHLVVPDTDLVPTSSRITPTGTFRLVGRGSYQPLTVAADSGLSSHFQTGGDQVLAAHQLLADLAMIYLDQPSVTPRAVAIEAPPSWIPNAGFLSALLAGLADDPVVQPVTLDGLFGLFPSSSDLPTKRLAVGTASTSPPSATQLRQARQQVGAFSSVVASPSPIVDTMNDLILLSESSELRASARVRYLSGVHQVLASQIADITLPPDRSITLTSRTATIPITIISAAPYPVHAVLEVNSDKLNFPHGTQSSLILDHRNKPVYIQVAAKTTGDSPLRVSLMSPQGGLVLLRGHFTIRSTATSGVAVALSVGAAVFLVVWWVLTWIRGRGERNRRLVPTSS